MNNNGEIIDLNDSGNLTVYLGDNRVSLDKRFDNADLSIWLNKTEVRNLVSVLMQFLREKGNMEYIVRDNNE